MQSFKIVAYLLLGYFWLVRIKIKKIVLIIKASLASAEVLAGAVAKADQYCRHKEKSIAIIRIAKSI